MEAPMRLIRFSLSFAVPFFIIMSILPCRAPAFEKVLANLPIEVCFSPQERCAPQILAQLDGAKTEILVHAFSFTSNPIRNALVSARKRGVRVEVILDKGEQVRQEFRTAKHLSGQSIPVFIDDQHSNAHNKVIVIDGRVVITGSYNFTNAAETRNAENLLILKSGELATQYARNWLDHKEHSSRY
jgi:phosphatidylserine/phosphatidylglycerophosphate/cardiolipin synthase-like enzyme